MNFWQREFPPPAQWDDRPPVLTLECVGCKDLVDLLNGEFEYDICRIHGGLARYCEECGRMTVWKQPDDAMPLRPEKEARRNRKLVEKPAAETAYGEAGAEKEERGEPPGESVNQPIAVPVKTEEAERRVRV